MNFICVDPNGSYYDNEKIISINISNLLDEVEQDVANIKMLSPKQSERSRYLFNSVCKDMDNGVLEEWICYKYNKQ